MEKNKAHILIVDDDNRIRDLLKEYLNENEYIVSTSENAENAKTKISHFKFDLICRFNLFKKYLSIYIMSI